LNGTNPRYTGDQGIRVTSLALEPLFVVQSILKKFAWLTAACKFELSECNATLKTFKPNASLPTTERPHRTTGIVWKVSRFCKSELNLNIFVLVEGRVNKIYSAVG